MNERLTALLLMASLPPRVNCSCLWAASAPQPTTFIHYIVSNTSHLTPHTIIRTSHTSDAPSRQ